MTDQYDKDGNTSDLIGLLRDNVIKPPYDINFGKVSLAIYNSATFAEKYPQQSGTMMPAVLNLSFEDKPYDMMTARARADIDKLKLDYPIALVDNAADKRLSILSANLLDVVVRLCHPKSPIEDMDQWMDLQACKCATKKHLVMITPAKYRPAKP